MCGVRFRGAELKMAREIVTLEVMPESPDVDLEALKAQVLTLVTDFVKEDEVETKVEQKPVAFGLQMLDVKFVRDEGAGDQERLAKDIAAIEGVRSCEVTQLQRALG